MSSLCTRTPPRRLRRATVGPHLIMTARTGVHAAAAVDTTGRRKAQSSETSSGGSRLRSPSIGPFRHRPTPLCSSSTLAADRPSRSDRQKIRVTPNRDPAVRELRSRKFVAARSDALPADSEMAGFDGRKVDDCLRNTTRCPGRDGGPRSPGLPRSAVSNRSRCPSTSSSPSRSRSPPRRARGTVGLRCDARLRPRGSRSDDGSGDRDAAVRDVHVQHRSSSSVPDRSLPNHHRCGHRGTCLDRHRCELAEGGVAGTGARLREPRSPRGRSHSDRPTTPERGGDRTPRGVLPLPTGQIPTEARPGAVGPDVHWRRLQAAVRRAALLGDGWIPHMQTPETLPANLKRLHQIRERAGRRARFQITVMADSVASVDDVRRFEEAGVDRLVVTPFRNPRNERRFSGIRRRRHLEDHLTRSTEGSSACACRPEHHRAPGAPIVGRLRDTRLFRLGGRDPNRTVGVSIRRLFYAVTKRTIDRAHEVAHEEELPVADSADLGSRGVYLKDVEQTLPYKVFDVDHHLYAPSDATPCYLAPEMIERAWLPGEPRMLTDEEYEEEIDHDRRTVGVHTQPEGGHGGVDLSSVPEMEVASPSRAPCSTAQPHARPRPAEPGTTGRALQRDATGVRAQGPPSRPDGRPEVQAAVLHAVGHREGEGLLARRHRGRVRGRHRLQRLAPGGLGLSPREPHLRARPGALWRGGPRRRRTRACPRARGQVHRPAPGPAYGRSPFDPVFRSLLGPGERGRRRGWPSTWAEPATTVRRRLGRGSEGQILGVQRASSGSLLGRPTDHGDGRRP